MKNVRSMQSGKMNIIQREMKRLEISIMRLSETRWKGQGHFNWNGYKIIMSGQAEKGRNGVAVMCDRASWLGFLLVPWLGWTEFCVRLPVLLGVVQVFFHHCLHA